MLPVCLNKRYLKYSFLATAVLLSFGFTNLETLNPLLWSQRFFLIRFDPDTPSVKLKKWDLTFTPDGFFRLKKYYPNGKQEYYSFNLTHFSDMKYLGTSTSGMLLIETSTDGIIVQTYNDPKGNIDSMSSSIKLPVKNAEPDQLDSLMINLKILKQSITTR